MFEMVSSVFHWQVTLTKHVQKTTLVSEVKQEAEGGRERERGLWSPRPVRA